MAIKHGIESLSLNPEIGRPFGRAGVIRELLISFGNSGYSALYSFDAKSDVVIILAVKHQKEEGY